MYEWMDTNFEDTDIVASHPYIPDATECLRCGLCVSGCPTFRLFQIDEQTPRRRLRTLSKILHDQQPIDALEREQLDDCLQCRACENICPSRMAYGELFDQAQAQLKPKLNWLAKIAFWLIEHKQWRMKLMPLLSVYLLLGLKQRLQSNVVLKQLGLANVNTLLSKPALKQLQAHYPTEQIKRGQVALFTGCITEVFDRETLLAAIKLLNFVGYDVLIPRQQNCCGAIHQHNGQTASYLINKNIKVFNSLEVDAVLYNDSGCGAMLSEYKGSDKQQGDFFRQHLLSVSDFLLTHWPDNLQLLPANFNIAVHEPCSQRNVLKNQKTVYTLLQKIPNLNIVTLPDNHLCCGAGGSYMLTHPENAQQLRTMKQLTIDAVSVDYVISSNFGCACFLNAEADKKVFHLLWLLAKQLP